MRTLSQHIFDLVQNSIIAGAGNIHLILEEDVPGNSFTMIIEDDGHGLTPEQLKRVKDTFFTTRSRKKRTVGLGLALMDATCTRAGGELVIESRYRHGTKVTANMEHDNVDRPPLGDLPDMLTSLFLSTSENKVLWKIEHVVNGRGYRLTNRKILDSLSLLSFAEKGIRDIVYEHIGKQEREIH